MSGNIYETARRTVRSEFMPLLSFFQKHILLGNVLKQNDLKKMSKFWSYIQKKATIFFEGQI